jgi:hypothetical protein
VRHGRTIIASWIVARSHAILDGVGPPAAALLVAALLAAGCAGRSPAPAAPSPGAAARQLVLLPLDVVAPVPPGLEPGVGFVEAELLLTLESHGKSVRLLAARDAHAAWLAAARDLKAEVGDDEMDFEGAARVLERNIARDSPFDALVLAWIVLRPAKVRGRSVRWDGVTRTLRVVNSTDRSLGFLDDFEAVAAVPSIQLAVFSAQGEPIFEGIGGLDLVHALTVEGDPPKIDARPHPREEVFSDRTSLREGIAIALDPFVPREP